MKNTSIKSAIFIIAFSINVTYCQIVQISMMKVGTFLGISLLQKMTKKKLVFFGTEASEKTRQGQQDIINVTPNDFHTFSNLPDTSFWATHSPFVEEYATILSQPKYQIIFIYRDPRDVITSLALYIRGKDKKFWPKAQQLSLDETITRLIVGGESLHVTSHHISKNGVRNMYESYLPWRNLSNVLSVRFEDLIGPKGGGNKDDQIRSIREIAHHIGKEISVAEAIAYGDTIFGKTHSFNKGQIGSWKEYFTPKHKQLFKKHAGQLLIDLGYETNTNW